MKFNDFYVEGKDGKSNCVIRSFVKVFNKEYDVIFNELCDIQKELGSNSFNDIEVFETFMKRNNFNKIKYDENIKIKDLKLDNDTYIILCWDKKDFYHMVAIINNTLFDRTDESFELYTINIYQKKH